MDPEVSHIRGVLANISGSISIACWIIILLPQLLEQWRLKSADGIAIGFLLAWFFGDLANLLGSIWGQLRPGLILLALWFCISDVLVISSYYYYKRLSNRESYISDSDQENRPPQISLQVPDSSAPLLQERYNTGDNREETAKDASNRSNWLTSTGLPGAFVIVVAILSYFISDSASESNTDAKTGTSALVLGYISAALYICARIPQIIQNHHRRSVEGLSCGFFTLSIIGNLTYAGQVVLYRTDREWLITYIPWLLGSLGTIAEDLAILAQFYMYKR